MSKTIIEHEAEFHAAAPEKKRPNAQSRATAKYEKKKGIVAKTFKLPESIVKDFVKACESKNEAQSKVLTKLMENYVKDSQS